MPAYLLLPFDFLKFWFIEVPKELTLYFFSLNGAFMELFSLPLMLRTFFRPIKNEYRQGLVGFSIAMGMFVKTWIIIFDLLLLLLLLVFEACVVLVFIMWPFVTLTLLFLR